MGDKTLHCTSARPGIMLVRPTLRSPTTPSHASIFKRWTIMHFNDLLNCPSPHGSKGIVRALRYTNADGQLLYTIHSDDLSIWQTQPYYAVSRRLDLENTRDVSQGESEVLEGDHEFGLEPMVWDVVDAAFGIFEEAAGSPSEGMYRNLPDALVSRRDKDSGCELVTLTFTPSSSVGGTGQTGEPEAPKELTVLHNQVIGILSDRVNVYSSIYRHRPDAQPEMHPPIPEGAHGHGTWVVCILVEDEVGRQVRTLLQTEVDGVQVGFWKGEVFMS